MSKKLIAAVAILSLTSIIQSAEISGSKSQQAVYPRIITDFEHKKESESKEVSAQETAEALRMCGYEFPGSEKLPGSELLKPLQRLVKSYLPDLLTKKFEIQLAGNEKEADKNFGVMAHVGITHDSTPIIFSREEQTHNKQRTSNEMHVLYVQKRITRLENLDAVDAICLPDKNIAVVTGDAITVYEKIGGKEVAKFPKQNEEWDSDITASTNNLVITRPGRVRFLKRGAKEAQPLEKISQDAYRLFITKKTYQGNAGVVYAARIDNQGKGLIVNANGPHVDVLNADSLETMSSFEMGHFEHFIDLCTDPRAPSKLMLLTMFNNSAIVIFKMTSLDLKFSKEITYEKSFKTVTQYGRLNMGVSMNNKVFILDGNDNSIRLLDLNQGVVYKEPIYKHNKPIISMKMSLDKSWLAIQDATSITIFEIFDI